MTSERLFALVRFKRSDPRSLRLELQAVALQPLLRRKPHIVIPGAPWPNILIDRFVFFLVVCARVARVPPNIQRFLNNEMSGLRA
jgi:hypothetical protein